MRFVPAVDGHSEGGVVGQAGDESSENRQLNQVTLGRVIRSVGVRRALKVGGL